MKQFLAENKLGAYSKLNKKTHSITHNGKEFEFSYQEYDDAYICLEPWSKDVAELAKYLRSQGVKLAIDVAPEKTIIIKKEEFEKRFMNEGEAAYEYEKGKAAGEKEEKEKLKEDSDENYDIFMDGVLDVLVKDKLITKADLDALNSGGADDLMDALHDEWEGFKNYEETGQAISRSDLNLAARAVAKKIGKLKEDLDQDRTDAQAEKMMDFLAEYEFAYKKIDGVCYKVDDEGNRTRVADHYCRYNETGKEKEEGYMGTQYGSSEDMAVDMVKKGITEKISPEAVERMEGLAGTQDLAVLKTKLMILASDWNQEGFEKEDVLEYLEHLLDTQFNESKKPMKEGEDVFADIDDDIAYGTDSKEDAIEYLEGIIDYCQKKIVELENEQGYEEEDLDEAIDAKSFGGVLKSDNPEGDALVLRFLQGIAKKFEYPVSHAAMFVKERIKKLGY